MEIFADCFQIVSGFCLNNKKDSEEDKSNDEIFEWFNYVTITLLQYENEYNLKRNKEIKPYVSILQMVLNSFAIADLPIASSLQVVEKLFDHTLSEEEEKSYCSNFLKMYNYDVKITNSQNEIICIEQVQNIFSLQYLFLELTKYLMNQNEIVSRFDLFGSQTIQFIALFLKYLISSYSAQYLKFYPEFDLNFALVLLGKPTKDSSIQDQNIIENLHKIHFLSIINLVQVLE